MGHVKRFDHIGITVADAEAVAEFFVALGLEVEGRMEVQGEFIDTVCGIPGSHTKIVALRAPDSSVWLELAQFLSPDHVAGRPDAMANELGLRNVSFEVDDIEAAVATAATAGYGLVGGIGEWQGAWKMAYVRGPEGLVVSLAQQIG